MTRPRVPGQAARRAILERKWRPGPGEAATDRRTFAQLEGLERYHRQPGTESPADRLRRERAEREAQEAASPPDSAQEGRGGPAGP